MGYLVKTEGWRALLSYGEVSDKPAVSHLSELSHAAGYAVETAVVADIPHLINDPSGKNEPINAGVESLPDDSDRGMGPGL